MNRAILCSAIEGLASKYGYSFQLNDESYYPVTTSRYPAAFLVRPEFVKIEGRQHGRVTYKISLILAQQGAKLSPQERSDRFGEMENQMIQLFVDLSQEPRVAVVDNLSITTKDSVDTHGAIAVVGEAKVETIF
jgi:hypothetical protein